MILFAFVFQKKNISKENIFVFVFVRHLAKNRTRSDRVRINEGPDCILFCTETRVNGFVTENTQV